MPQQITVIAALECRLIRIAHCRAHSGGGAPNKIFSIPRARTRDFWLRVEQSHHFTTTHVVSLTGYDRKAGDLDFAKVFESCSALEHLLLDFSSDELFNDEGFEAPKRLPFDLNSVKQFYLPDIVMVESYALSFSLCLIRSFPYLEYLEIDVLVYSEEHGGCILESLELKHFSDSTFNHLREVKLVCFAGTTPEMQLIKLLLAKSPVLVRMLIACNLDDEHLDARLRIFAEVSTFLRASPEAEVVYEKFEDHIIFD